MNAFTVGSLVPHSNLSLRRFLSEVHFFSILYPALPPAGYPEYTIFTLKISLSSEAIAGLVMIVTALKNNSFHCNERSVANTSLPNVLYLVFTNPTAAFSVIPDTLI